jgi:lipopolysaccharide transport system ATP-binding protein
MRRNVMADIAIHVEDLRKAYRLGTCEDAPDTLVQAAIATLTAPIRNLRHLRRLNTYDTDRESKDILWALSGVSFDVRRGEFVGIIGRNGAGKSTLLKILSRITEPTEGRVTIRGRVSSLLEVGTGFHPELSGRENIYMNGTILGMRNKEIRAKFQEIVEFSGVERFLDTPVKRYSSGMKVRLAFSVAAHLEPEVLIIDEVLAVGDAEFQKKCMGKMQDVAGHGRTVLFVSHNMGAIQALCQRAICLQSGQVVDDGSPPSVISRYLRGMMEVVDGFSPDNPERRHSGPLTISSARILDHDGHPSTTMTAGRPMSIEVDYLRSSPVASHLIRAAVYDQNGIKMFQLNPRLLGCNPALNDAGSFRCTLPNVPLPLGRYRIALQAVADEEESDWIPNALYFTVDNSVFFPSVHSASPSTGCVMVEQQWNHT